MKTVTPESLAEALSRVEACPIGATSQLAHVLQLELSDLWPFAPRLVSALPKLISPRVPRQVIEKARTLWFRLNQVYPRRLWVLTVNAFRPTEKVDKIERRDFLRSNLPPEFNEYNDIIIINFFLFSPAPPLRPGRPRGADHGSSPRAPMRSRHSTMRRHPRNRPPHATRSAGCVANSAESSFGRELLRGLGERLGP